MARNTFKVFKRSKEHRIVAIKERFVTEPAPSLSENPAKLEELTRGLMWDLDWISQKSGSLAEAATKYEAELKEKGANEDIQELFELAISETYAAAETIPAACEEVRDIIRLVKTEGHERTAIISAAASSLRAMISTVSSLWQVWDDVLAAIGDIWRSVTDLAKRSVTWVRQMLRKARTAISGFLRVIAQLGKPEEIHIIGSVSAALGGAVLGMQGSAEAGVELVYTPTSSSRAGT